MNKKLKYSTLLLALLLLFSTDLFSQEEELISPYISLQYFKNNESQRSLKTALTYSINRMELPLPEMEISFFNDEGGKHELIATILTDENGVARLELTKDIDLQADDEGFWHFSSEFIGNDTIEASSYEISVKDVNLEMKLEELDSIKTITVKATTNENGIEKPVSDETVIVYVPRMFSLLPVGELYLDESGSAFMEFPSDLPGDKDGILTVIARFEENMTFENVEKTETLMWGMPTDYSVPKSHRALWTKTAPKWMIYTLSILLAGVWGHYIYAMISLVRIKKDADSESQKYGKYV